MRRVRNRHLIVSDVISLPVACYVSFVLRLEQLDLGEYWLSFVLVAGLALLLTPLIFHITGVYTRYWHYASTEELILLASSVTLAILLTTVLSLAVASLMPTIYIPRSIPFIFGLLALAATAGPRLALRLASSHRFDRRSRKNFRSVLVMGAGRAGMMIVRELHQNPSLGMKVVGLLDDDPKKHAMRIYGVRVLGDRHAIPRLAKQLSVAQLIIVMPTASGKVIREVVNACEQIGVETKTIPGIYELVGGTISVNQLRNVEIEDLLRRPPVNIDNAAVAELIAGKRVLITGGGGSIGSELCRHVLQCEPSELVVLGHGENSVFDIQAELLRYLAVSAKEARHGGKHRCQIKAVIADIRFPERIHAVFKEHSPEIVFHAAAHKHVPLMEMNPVEAITNNVLGTRNLLRAALELGVEHFVMISTDKAVNPTSIMGASKRVAELLVHRAAKSSGKPYVAVRFGNVLGSRGSVVHTFKRQIAVGGPITITHPEMRRYFMTIPEAVQLVLQSAVIGHGGEVFTLEMGEPVKIMDLAQTMIELSGLEVGKDIEIVFSGLRPGEKLFEELFVAGEEYQHTCHNKIRVATNAGNFVPSSLDKMLDELAIAAQQNDSQGIVQLLRHLVPEFRIDYQEVTHLVDMDQRLSFASRTVGA